MLCIPKNKLHYSAGSIPIITHRKYSNGCLIVCGNFRFSSSYSTNLKRQQQIIAKIKPFQCIFPVQVVHKHQLSTFAKLSIHSNKNHNAKCKQMYSTPWHASTDVQRQTPMYRQFQSTVHKKSLYSELNLELLKLKTKMLPLPIIHLDI